MEIGGVEKIISMWVAFASSGTMTAGAGGWRQGRKHVPAQDRAVDWLFREPAAWNRLKTRLRQYVGGIAEEHIQHATGIRREPPCGTRMVGSQSTNKKGSADPICYSRLGACIGTDYRPRIVQFPLRNNSSNSRDGACRYSY